MNTLDELAIKYGTDKSSEVHFYTRYYEKYFEPFRNKPIRLLEIGVQDGKSLKMWQDYFPKGEIIGMDIKDCGEYFDDRISIAIGDQGNKKHLLQMGEQLGPYDIIIDDGSHINKHLLLTFNTLFPFLKPQGIYVAEDLHTCYWGRGFGRPTFIKRLKDLIDEVNCGGKSGIADRTKDRQEGGFMWNMRRPTWWETNVEFMHLYRGIVFIKRYD